MWCVELESPQVAAYIVKHHSKSKHAKASSDARSLIAPFAGSLPTAKKTAGRMCSSKLSGYLQHHQPIPLSLLRLCAVLQVDVPSDNRTLDECPICYIPMFEATTLQCKHVFCAPCLTQLHSARCPLCRSEIDHPESVQEALIFLHYDNILQPLKMLLREAYPIDVIRKAQKMFAESGASNKPLVVLKISDTKPIPDSFQTQTLYDSGIRHLDTIYLL